MPNLFDAFTINRMRLRNRFVRSATMDYLADGGMVSDPLLSLYRELARGEVGLIVTGGLYVAKDGQTVQGQLRADTDEVIPGLARLAATVRESGGKIAAQLLHSGWNCRPEVTGLQPVGPSCMISPTTGVQVRELSADEICELAEMFVRAAERVVEAGFDAIQLHTGHSHLMSSFLSPVTNRREDEWGGSPERRSHFLRRVCQGIRKSVGADYPILVKLGLVDYHPNGKPLSEGLDTARRLEADGIDAIEVSEGLEKESRHHIRLDATSPYYVAECRQARQALHVPLILVGGMRKIPDMKAVLDEGIADGISMCRPFIMDPHIVQKLREGLTDESGCISCNGCLGRRGDISCTLEDAGKSAPQ